MEGTWNVYYQNRKAGSCVIKRQGLYYKFVCHSDRAAEGICRLMLQCGDGVTDLGVLVPEQNGFGLEKRVAVRNLPDGEPRFYIRSAQEKRGETFIPVRVGEPFAYLSRLNEARFARQNGEVGVVLDDHAY